MPDDDSSDMVRSKRSLLSQGRARPRVAQRAASLLSVSLESESVDPVLRHRLARSRRDPRPSPLLDALARLERGEAGPAEAQAAPAETDEEPAASGGWRRSLRNLLSSRVRFRKPEGKEPPAAAEAQAVPPSGPEPQPLSPERPRGAPAPAFVRQAAAEDESPLWRPLIDPMLVISAVAGSKALIAATTAIGLVIGVAVALTTPKKYEAFSELLVDPRDLKVSDRDLTQTGLTSDALLALVENQVRLMTSGTVLAKVVDRLKLYDDPEFNGTGGGAGIGGVVSSLRALLSSGSPSPGDGNRHAVAVENLAEALSVERAGRTFVVTVSAKTTDPEKSALIVNTLDQVFLERSGELQSDTAGRAADELSARLAELRAGVEEAERKVATFRAEHDLIDAQGRLISEDELIRLNDQLAAARAQTMELNARAQSVRSLEVDAVIGGGLPEELTSPVMSELRSQYAALRQEADRLSVRLGPRHPQHLSVQAQLRGAREQISAELRRIGAAVQTQLKRAVQVEQDLAARLAQLKVRSGDVKADLVTLRELEREAAAKRTVYENFLLRAREAGEQRDINTANISVISQAFPPLSPNGPSRSTIAMTGGVLGFLAGIALAVARGVFWSLRERARREDGAEPARERPGPLSWLLERFDRNAREAEAPKPASRTESGQEETRARAEAGPDEEGTDMNYYPQSPYHPTAPGPGQQPGPQAAFPQQVPWPYAYPFPPQSPHAYDPAQPYPAMQYWQPVAQPYGYGYAPAPAHPHQQAGAAWPQATRGAAETVASARGRELSPLEEVRESLREVREAIRELVEDRARRR